MSDTQTIFLQLIGLAIVIWFASRMLHAVYKIIRSYLGEAVDIAKRFPALVGMLGILAAIPVVLIVTFAFGGA